MTTTPARERPPLRHAPDWRLRSAEERRATADELARIQRPFALTPQCSPTIPSENTVKIRHVYPLAIIPRIRPPTPDDDTMDSGEEGPFTLDDLDDDEYRYLEGNFPKEFKGDRSRTRAFLAEFKRFMRMNEGANIEKDPMKKCAYFLSLISGPEVEYWVSDQCDWLKSRGVDEDPTTELPRGMTAWQALEQRFKSMFIDSAEKERALHDILKLRMKEGNVDRYIADFKRLARLARMDIDDSFNLELFARGLPIRLAKSCIDLERPETFEQWAKAAQNQQKNWLWWRQRLQHWR